MSAFVQPIAQKLNIKLQQVAAVVSLLEEGATIPFIARYRKDKTGGLDEVQIQQIQDEAKFTYPINLSAPQGRKPPGKRVWSHWLFYCWSKMTLT